MKIGDKFPLVDVTPEIGYKDKFNYLVEYTGEIRKPKKGEFFLSGAIIQGYYASNDLSYNYPIGKLRRK